MRPFFHLIIYFGPVLFVIVLVIIALLEYMFNDSVNDEACKQGHGHTYHAEYCDLVRRPT